MTDVNAKTTISLKDCLTPFERAELGKMEEGATILLSRVIGVCTNTFTKIATMPSGETKTLRGAIGSFEIVTKNGSLQGVRLIADDEFICALPTMPCEIDADILLKKTAFGLSIKAVPKYSADIIERLRKKRKVLLGETLAIQPPLPTLEAPES